MISKRGLRIINPADKETEEPQRCTPSYKAYVVVAKDTQNRRLWDQISELKFWSEFDFLQYVIDGAFASSSHACAKPTKVKVFSAVYMCKMNILKPLMEPYQYTL
ncbi:hypothetical protein MAM1_0219d08241 [Mucor ambiguus]|uniref:Uncharacterized protein n=1 Tax=Mucor ambiguus TaxID=91626 RepID=A0A0C9MDL4_9FUNG|nr:hypothetical protein MAM1_0219d08241 [Mucor ambiguus]